MEPFKDFQRGLVAAWQDYAAGKIDAKTLKGTSAGFGIYQQRDDRTMMRVRRVGGLVSADDLRKVSEMLRTHGGDFAHLTTRQDIQLHGIPAAEVTSTLADCEAAGFRFRGGGGDTFRNTLVSAYSGLHEDSVFDVLPYAQALSEFFYGFDVAYGLPRKLKIAFADRPADRHLAMTNDLGFVAKVVEGRPVFETYLAGGIGFRPRLGLKLFEVLPAGDCIRVAMALAMLFNDHGCRTNRAHARIRFLREDLGDEGLVTLLKEYLAKVPATAEFGGHAGRVTLPVVADDTEVVPPSGGLRLDAAVTTGTTGVSPVAATPAFGAWRQLAVTPLRDGRRPHRDRPTSLAAVRIFVPYGNFTSAEIDAFVAAMDAVGVTQFQILPTQDFGVVVPTDRVENVYGALAALERDYVVRSFVGHIRTCIGCTVCKSGITDAPAIGKAVAEYFDAKYLPLDKPDSVSGGDNGVDRTVRIAVAKALLDEVRISGCPNSCTAHQLAQFGFAGRKLNGEDAVTVYTPGSLEPVALGAPDESVASVPKSEFPAFLEQRILACKQ